MNSRIGFQEGQAWMSGMAANKYTTPRRHLRLFLFFAIQYLGEYKGLKPKKPILTSVKRTNTWSGNSRESQEIRNKYTQEWIRKPGAKEKCVDILPWTGYSDTLMSRGKAKTKGQPSISGDGSLWIRNMYMSQNDNHNSLVNISYPLT